MSHVGIMPGYREFMGHSPNNGESNGKSAWRMGNETETGLT